MRIINEPTAAVLAYGLGKKLAWRDKCADFLSRRWDFRCFHSDEGAMLVVIFTACDSHLGSRDIDNISAKHCVQEFQRQRDLKACGRTAKGLRRHRKACELAKRSLYSSFEANIEFDA